MANIVKIVEREALDYTGVIERQAAQIYRLSSIIDDLLEMLVKHEILTDEKIKEYF